MSTIRSCSLLLALGIAASSCGADTAAPPDGAALVENEPAPTAEVETSAPANLFLPTVTDMPDRLELVTAGDLDGPTVQPAGNLVDGATWDGTLRMTLSLDGDLGWTQPLVEVGFAVAVDQIGSDEWRYLVSYSEASLAELVDNSAAQDPELAQELMASYSDLSVISTVNSFGIVTDTQTVGVERLPAIYQLDVKDFATQMSDLPTPVAAGELGVGAIWTDKRMTQVFEHTVEATYTYEIVAIDGPVYTVDFSFAAVSSAENDGVGDVSASGSIVAEVGQPMPLQSSFTVSAVLPLGLEDPADPTASIDVVVEGS